jgi:hypothetical protein
MLNETEGGIGNGGLVEGADNDTGQEEVDFISGFTKFTDEGPYTRENVKKWLDRYKEADGNGSLDPLQSVMVSLTFLGLSRTLFFQDLLSSQESE